MPNRQDSQREFGRISPSRLIDMSLSPYSATPNRMSAIIAGSTSLLVAAVLLFQHVPTPIVIISSLVILGLGVVVPWETLAEKLQQHLNAGHAVSESESFPVPDTWNIVDDIRVGDMVCLKRDHEAATKDARRKYGRTASVPEARFRLVLAFMREDGNRTVVAFGDGTIGKWSRRANVFTIPATSDMSGDESRSSADAAFIDLLSDIERTPTTFGAVLKNQATKTTDLKTVNLVLGAQAKWRLIEATEPGQLLRLTDSGRVWVAATSDGYARHIRSRKTRNSTSGDTVTNHFYGPSNYVQGANFGQMNATQAGPEAPSRMLASIREILDDRRILWHGDEAVRVRDELQKAAEERDSDRARSALRRFAELARQSGPGITRATTVPHPDEKVEPRETDRRPLVFLCHSSNDKEQVRKLYHRLVADGIRCWFDEEDILPGQNWDLEIRKAMQASRWVVAFLTRGSMTKTMVQHSSFLCAWRIVTFPTAYGDCSVSTCSRMTGTNASHALYLL
jgi:TIR domain